jgi:hypothetical protein
MMLLVGHGCFRIVCKPGNFSVTSFVTINCYTSHGLKTKFPKMHGGNQFVGLGE